MSYELGYSIIAQKLHDSVYIYLHTHFKKPKGLSKAYM